MTGVKQRPCIIRPALFIEVGCKEPTRLILQQRINSGDKITGSGIATTQMLLDDVIGWGDECLMRAFPALNLRLSADPSYPLVGTGR
jgi:hypothetical protein